ncbi:MAG: AMP-binding protein [Muribaculaceae bacterium]|nr:AMP-binding protein [Muribaculaceae bacterium]
MAYVMMSENTMTFEEFLAEWRGESPVITVRTSGSTGTPKCIELDKEFVRGSGRRTNSFFHITSESRLHSCVGVQFIGGKMMAVRSELAGCRLTWETPSNTPLSGIAPNEVIDLLAVVPSQMLHILAHLEEMPTINAIIIGGSAIHPQLRERIIASGLNAYETYGMTETASHIALRKIERGEEWFKPLKGIKVSLDDRGCLVICFERGERIVTNDLAIINKDSGFKILGRYDNVIVTGGKKVNPEDVERRIASLIKGDFIITSRPDEKWGERIVLRIERGASSETTTGTSATAKTGSESGLLRLLKTVLEPYEVPKEIEWVDRL